MRIALAAALAAMSFSGAALGADSSFEARLSPGPRLVGTRAEHSGGGSFKAGVSKDTLTLDGAYHGLLGNPTSAYVAMGSAPGVRGPKIADLTIAAATTGKFSGTVKLDAKSRAALARGGLYIEIDSNEAPEGDLWGWVMPPSE